jgi:hypothetical protein
MATIREGGFAIAQWRTPRPANAAAKHELGGCENAVWVHSENLIRALINRRRPFGVFAQRQRLVPSVPSRLGFSTPLSSLAKSKVEIASLSLRLTTSGIVMSKLRNPASMCAT